MAKAKVISKLINFVRQNATAMDRALARAAVDIERLAKERVPVELGHLKASGKHVPKGMLRHEVRFDKEYAAYQERGSRLDGSRKVKHYTTPNTGKDFLKNAGKTIAPRLVEYFKQEAGMIKV